MGLVVKGKVFGAVDKFVGGRHRLLWVRPRDKMFYRV